MFVRPNPLRIASNPEYVVPDPDLRDFLPAEGRAVVESAYWHKLLAVEDVIEGEIESEKDASTTNISTDKKAKKG